MKTFLFVAVSVLVLPVATQAQKMNTMVPQVQTDEPEALPEPPVYAPVLAPLPTLAPLPGPAPVYHYEQHPLDQPPSLLSVSEAQTIESNFRAKFPDQRIVIYVNRQLVADSSGLRLSARTERVETTRTTGSDSSATNSTRTVTDNTYKADTSAPASLADRQTTRDVERLVGGPFRDAGAALVDQSTANALLGGRSPDPATLSADSSRADRDKLASVADIAVEVLVSSKSVKVQEISGDHNYTLPDITATAIRLKDAKVLGQASATDVINRAGNAGYAARNFSVDQITEATALALMDDMAAEAK